MGGSISAKSPYRELEQFAKKYANKIDTIYVLTWDRFSRDTLLAYQKLDLFKRLGITVQAIEQPIDCSIPENKILLSFYLSYPQVENERRSLKILSGVREGKKNGRYYGKSPYGYDNKRDDVNKPIIVPNDKAKIVKKIFQLIVTGFSHRK